MRLELEGFLTYRTGQALDFRGMRIGAVVGPNGEGKSSLFDGITFAAFGAHRAGLDDADQLINQESNELKVRLEFEVSGHSYRVDRSLARRPGGRTRPTAHAMAYEWDGTAWHAITVSSGPRACTRWVEGILGMNYESFRSSVLLQQNAQDRFLLASPAERQKTLNAILNLDPYRQLEVAARDRRKSCQAEVTDLVRRLDDLVPHDDETLSLLRQTAIQLSEARKLWEDAYHSALQRVDVASRFHQAALDLRAVEKAIAEQQDLLRHSDEIHYQAARYRALCTAVPLLKSGWSAEVSARRAEAEASDFEQRASAINVAEYEKAGQEKRAVADEAAARLRAAVGKDNELRREEAKLRPMALVLGTADGNRKSAKERREQAEKLAITAAGYESLTNELERLRVLELDLGNLREYTRAREWRASRLRSRAAAVQTIKETVSLIEAASRAVSDAEGKARHAEVVRKRAERSVGEQTAVLAEKERQLDQRRQAVDEAVCSRCGALIDPEQVAREIADLTEAVAGMEAARELARDQLLAAEKNEQLADGRLEEARAVQGSREDTLRGARAELEQIDKTLELDYVSAALDKLSPTIKGQIARDAAFPRKTDIDTCAADVARLPHISREAEVARQAKLNQSNLLELAKELEREAANLEAQVPSAERALVRSRWPQLGALLAATSRLCEGALVQRDETQKAAELAESAYLRAVSDRETFLGKAQNSRRLALSHRAQRDNCLQNVAVAFRSAASDPRLIAELEREAKALSDAEDRLQKLDSATAVLNQHMGRKQELCAVIDGVAHEDRRTLAEAKGESDVALKHLEEARNREREADITLRRTEEVRDQAEGIGVRLRAQQLLLSDWRLLELLLGRDNLQGRLVEDARIGIAEAANKELETISHGTLRMEMTRDADNDALHLRVLDSTSVIKAIDPAFLSGSQRFRVAVALALGIGQYVGGASRGPNAVIIDEGFGSLDIDGLQAMGEHLRSIAGRVEQVLLVTHNLDMQSYVPNGFRVEKRERSTAVTRF